MIHSIYSQSNSNLFKPSLNAAQKVRSSFLGNNTVSAAKHDDSTSNNRHIYDLLKVSADHFSEYRVSTCQKVPIVAKNPDGTISESTVVSLGRTDDGRCKYAGLGYCGSLWLCPLCARVVAPSRVAEVKHAMGENAKRGGQSVFVTFTQPHYKQNNLIDLIRIQSEALSRMKATRKYKDLVAKYGFLGEIRAFEITYGKNGWHPHIHAVYLFENITINKDIDAFKECLSSLWASYVVKSGGVLPSFEHGVDVRLPRKGDTDEIAAYVAKWGEELTLSHTKRGKSDSVTPFQLLDTLKQGYCYKTYALLKEYAASTKGRARLFWSRGLKANFEIEEFNDQELAEKPAPTHLMDMTWLQYKTLRQVGLSGDVLDMAEKYPLQFVEGFIRDVESMYKKFIVDEEREYKKARNDIQELSRQSVHNELRCLGLL